MEGRESKLLPGKKKSSTAEGQRPLVRNKQPSSAVHDRHDLGARRTILPKPQPVATTTRTTTAAAALPRTQEPKVSTTIKRLLPPPTTQRQPKVSLPRMQQPKVSSTTKPPLPPPTTQLQPKVSTTTKPPLPPRYPVRLPKGQPSGHDGGGDHRMTGKRSAVTDRGPASANQSFPSKCYRSSSSSSSSSGSGTAPRSKTLPLSSLPFKKRLTQGPSPETSIKIREDDRPVKKSDNLRQEPLAAAPSQSKSDAATTVQDTPAGVRLSGSSHQTSRVKPGWGRGMPPLPPPGGGSGRGRGGKRVVRFADQLQDGPDPTVRK
ncbi:uncharacterized protein LOC116254449 [Nymphaea colorata]|uniref:uncharacterized protein LOC116254449 n=1 Tax=Nymphaea colorata TaxID=210225 RepID=UPI00129EEF02|nr:uncharacterized protein LOC116254449 [Nymphaea colorata]